MSSYYRELEKGERWQKGDLMFGQGLLPEQNIRLRPVTITEAPPASPAQRVSDETWVVSVDKLRIEVEPCALLPLGDSVADNPQDSQSLSLWPQRAKRICAGQEALKLIEKLGDWCLCSKPGEVERILSMLKEDGQ